MVDGGRLGGVDEGIVLSSQSLVKDAMNDSRGCGKGLDWMNLRVRMLDVSWKMRERDLLIYFSDTLIGLSFFRIQG